MKTLKRVAPDMGGVSVYFEEAWIIMRLPVTLDDPDRCAEGIQM